MRVRVRGVGGIEIEDTSGTHLGLASGMGMEGGRQAWRALVSGYRDMDVDLVDMGRQRLRC